MAHARLTTEQLKELVRTLYLALKGESPLPCALIAGAYLDKAVITLLSNFFVEGDNSDQLCDENKGVLRDSASRVKVAYCLGLITKEALQNLSIIAQVRNQFAHSHIPLDFNAERIVQLCDKLILPPAPDASELSKYGQDFEADCKGFNKYPARLLFELATVITAFEIEKQADQVQRRQRSGPQTAFSSLPSAIAWWQGH